MEGCDQTVRHTPISQLSIEETMLRLNLLRVEFESVREAMGVHEDAFGWHMDEVRKPLDRERCLRALTDLLYVTFGTYHTLGLGEYANAAFDAVHRSNMTKIGPNGKCQRDLNGRVLKGPNYMRPNFDDVFNPPSNPFDSTK